MVVLIELLSVFELTVVVGTVAVATGWTGVVVGITLVSPLVATVFVVTVTEFADITQFTFAFLEVPDSLLVESLGRLLMSLAASSTVF